MPEQNQPINTLPIKTASGMAATDYLLGIDSAEGYQMLIQDLGDYIIQHATSSLAGSNQTLADIIGILNDRTKYETITDFNTFRPTNSTGTGVLRRYGYCTSDSASNAPISGDNYTWRGYAEGTGSSAYCEQHFTAGYATNAFNRGRSFIRVYINGTWTPWIELNRTGFGWLPNNTNIDNITQSGVYGLISGHNYTTLPTGYTAGGILEVYGAVSDGTYAMQRLSTSINIYIRYRYVSSGTSWSTWQKLPTRAEVDTLNSNKASSSNFAVTRVPGNQSYTYSAPYGFFFFTESDDKYAIYRKSNTTMNLLLGSLSANITITDVTSNGFTINNSNSWRCTVWGLL